MVVPDLLPSRMDMQGYAPLACVCGKGGGWGSPPKSKIVEIEKTRFSKIVDFQKKIEKVEKVKMRVSPSEA